MKAQRIELVTLSTGELLEVYRAPCGGVFGIDATFLEQVASDADDTVFDPFNGQEVSLTN